VAGGEPDTRGNAQDQSEAAIPISLLLPLVLAVAAGIFVYTSDTALPVPGFYGVAAQIIPILMIAFALEGRATEQLSEPQMGIYRAQLFLFLLVGEVFALLGASGSLRGQAPKRFFQEGLVAEDYFWSNVIAAATTIGLVGGFAMLTVLALFWGKPGWLRFSFGKRPDEASEAELQLLRERLASLESKLDTDEQAANRAN